MPASFTGISLGEGVNVTWAGNPAAEVIAEFFGVDGYQWMPGGTRGYKISAQGTLWGMGPEGLAELQNAFENLRRSQREYVLVDSLGQAWPAARITAFRPTGPVMRDGPRWGQAYTAEFDQWI